MICCNFCYKQHSNNSNLLVLVCLIVRFDPNYFTVILHFCIVGFYFRPKYPGISFTPCLIFYKRFRRRQPYENKWIKHKKFIYYYFFNRWMIYNFTLPSLVFSIVKIRKADIFHNISHNYYSTSNKSFMTVYLQLNFTKNYSRVSFLKLTLGSSPLD